MNNSKKIFDYLDILIPEPKSELNYNRDYELLIAVMLSAQTTDRRVNEVTKVLFSQYPDLESLSKAKVEEIENIIRCLGTYSKKSKNIIEISLRLLNEANSKVPNNREFLESLPGVGRKTANVVLSVLYDVNCIAVDTHVARVSKRLGLAGLGDDVLTIENKLYKVLPPNNMIKYHHQLLLFGRYYCKAINPLCENCKLKDICKEKKKSI